MRCSGYIGRDLGIIRVSRQRRCTGKLLPNHVLPRQDNVEIGSSKSAPFKTTTATEAHTDYEYSRLVRVLVPTVPTC